MDAIAKAVRWAEKTFRAKSEAVPPASNKARGIAGWGRLGKVKKKMVDDIYACGWTDRGRQAVHDRDDWIEEGFQSGWVEGHKAGVLETVGTVERKEQAVIEMEGNAHLRYARAIADKVAGGKFAPEIVEPVIDTGLLVFPSASVGETQAKEERARVREVG